MMMKFVFEEDILSQNLEESCVVVVPQGVETEEHLLNTIATHLHFPYYFGENWDAFYECMRDLNWIVAKTIIIKHLDLPFETDKENRKIYLTIMDRISTFWSKDDDHSMVIIFRPEYELPIQRVLTEVDG